MPRIVGLCIALLVGVSTSVVWSEEEPMYQGKPLSYWCEMLQETASPPPADYKAAPTALRTLGAPAVPYLIEFLSHDAAKVRSRAAGALLGMDPKPKEAVPARITALSDSDKYVRHFAPQVLAEIGPDAAAAVPALIAALKDPAMEVRVPVTMALGAMGAAAKAAVPALTEALQDEDRHVREGAATALKKIRGE